MTEAEKILFLTDLDGTLLPASKEIRQEDLAAIRRFQEAGGKFAIATGRTLQAAQYYLKQLRPNVPVILFNGAGIYDPVTETMLDTVTLPPEAAEITRIVLDAFPDVSAEILTAEETFVPRMSPYEEEHLRICRVTPQQMPLHEIPKAGWLKVLFAMHPDRMAAVTAFFQEKAWNCADFVQSEPRFFEMLPKAVTKGSALEKYRTMGLAEGCRIVAVGDFDNDLEMLQAADISACPSNAQPCVQEIVDVQLMHSCEDGAIAELLTTKVIYERV